MKKFNPLTLDARGVKNLNSSGEKVKFASVFVRETEKVHVENEN